MLLRIVLFALLTTGVWVGDAYYHARVQPERATRVAVATVNGNDRDFATLRLNNTATGALDVLPWVMTVALFFMCIGGTILGSARKAIRS